MKNKAANTAIKIMNKMKYFTLFVFRVNKNKVSVQSHIVKLENYTPVFPDTLYINVRHLCLTVCNLTIPVGIRRNGCF